MSTIETLRSRFRQYRDMGRAAIEQVSDQDIQWTPDAESNSIAIIVKHIHGNARSRFTDFLTTDGEKPDRHRDNEFIPGTTSKSEVLDGWDAAWSLVFGALDPLTDADLTREVAIRSEKHTVLDAILRQLAHYAYHIGQIVYIAKHRSDSNWRTLSIAKGRSEEYVVKQR
jgi:hypothetical protein